MNAHINTDEIDQPNAERALGSDGTMHFSKPELASYVVEMTKELSDLSLAAKLNQLSSLLEEARKEASKIANLPDE